MVQINTKKMFFQNHFVVTVKEYQAQPWKDSGFSFSFSFR